MEKKNLPSLVDLYKGDLEQLKNQNDLNILLNHEPPEKWLKAHPFIKRKDEKSGQYVPLVYLPIERVEYLLTSLFVKWNIEVKNVITIANSVLVMVRVHYRDPVTGEMEWQDGLGASPMQTDEGAGATDFNKIKSGAVMMAAPAAKSFAIKDAAEHLGKMFGKDLNRADQIAYESMAGKFDDTEKWLKILSEKVGLCQDGETTDSVLRDISQIEVGRKVTGDDYKELLKKYFDYETTD